MPWWWKKTEPLKARMEVSPKVTKAKATQVEDARPLREQLLQAQARLRREIEILESPTGILRAPNCSDEIVALAAELREIEAALAGLGLDEA